MTGVTSAPASAASLVVVGPSLIGGRTSFVVVCPSSPPSELPPVSPLTLAHAGRAWARQKNARRGGPERMREANSRMVGRVAPRTESDERPCGLTRRDAQTDLGEHGDVRRWEARRVEREMVGPLERGDVDRARL